MYKDYWIGVKSYPQANNYVWLLAKNNETLPPRLTYWGTTPVLQSSQYNNTCAYVRYNSTSSDIAWYTDRCNVKKNFVCKKPEGSCQPGWIAHQNRCYQFNTQYLLPWNRADKYCKSQGGRLVESYGNTATNFLNSYLDELQDARIDSFWIGATDNNTANFTWSYGQQINKNGYQNWLNNTPINTPNKQDCAFISTDDVRGKWRTTPSCGLKKAFVCIIGFDQPVTTVTTPKPTFKCDDHWTLNSGRCFQLNDTRKTWMSARDSCASQGGSLATVDTRDVHSFLINKIDRNDNEYWIGLNDLTENRKHVWIGSGAALGSFNDWCKNEPNDYGGTENCVEYFTTNKCWNDRGCEAKLKYICQKQPQGVPIRPPVTTTPMPISLKCGLGWEERPQSPYCYSFHDDQLTWQDARTTCQQLGGDLASIHNRAEQVYIQTKISSYSSMWMWLAGTDRNKEGGWSWADGTAFQFVNWAGGEPNGKTRENCIQIYSQIRNQQWNDGSCNGRQGFICKKQYGKLPAVTPRPTPKVPTGQYLGCPPFWKKFGDSCWHFVKNMKTADAARTACMKTGGYLATVNSDDEQAFVISNLPKPMRNGNGIFNGGAYWIGLSDRVAENYFVWDDGVPVKYTNWGYNEPNNFRNYNEDCIGMWLLDGGWFDVNCKVPLPGYICRQGLQVVATTGLSQTQQGCTKPFRGVGFGASCYRMLAKENNFQQVDWQSAQIGCRALNSNSQLATVNDRYVQAFLSAYIDTSSDYFWIGMSDVSTPGTYTWIQGQNVKFTDWYSTHTGNERGTCVAMRASHPIGLWESRNCSEPHNYICETPRTGFTNAPTTLPPVLPCPPGWTAFSNFCYKTYSSSMTWVQGREFCRGFGGDLLSLQSQPENDFVLNTLNARSSYWLGINDWDTEKVWIWSDKSAVTFTNWNPNEPNNYNNEDCAIIVGNGKWVDINCFSKIKPLCKRPKGIPLPTTQAPPQGFTSPVCGVESMWLFYNGSCYMTSPSTGRSTALSWYDARKYCNSYKSDLASIHTSDENQFIFSQAKLKFKEEYWIGLNELENPGKFRWINNETLDFVNWDRSEPNDDYGAERCAAMKAVNGNWMDDNCNMKMGFICKKTVGEEPPTPAPTPLISGGCLDPSFIPSPFSNKCFYIRNSTNLLTWNQSLTFCQNNFQQRYDMASISDETEQAFLTSLVQGMAGHLWIGLNDFRKNRQFVWQDNSPVRYTHWNSGEPNGRYSYSKTQGGFIGSERCVEMYTEIGLAGYWNDKSCAALRNVICQGKKVQGLPDTATVKDTCTKPEYTQRGTSCYKFIGSPEQSRQNASNICKADGGVLATVNDVYENAYIESNMGPNVDYWIGLSYNKISTTYAWQDSWPVHYTSWAYGEPSHGPNDICVKSRNGLWDSTSCTRNMGYVCEINSAPIPAPTPAPAGHCRNPGEFISGDFCYYFSPLKYMDWPSARYTCAKRGMELASISSYTELLYVFSISLNARDRQGRHTAKNIWIGLNKGLFSGFQWADGTAFSYTNWNVGEPSDAMNSTREECVEMYRDTGKWNDVTCFKQNGFVCKGRALLGSTASPPTTITPAPTQKPTKGPQIPQTIPTFPNIFPFTTLKPTTKSQQIVTTNPPVFTNPAVKTPRLTNAPIKSITVKRINGHLNGPSGHLQNRVINKKHGLTGGPLAAVIVVAVVVLGVVGMIGLLYWKKRNPSTGSGGSGSGSGTTGFDNALYNKDKEEVNIDNSDP